MGKILAGILFLCSFFVGFYFLTWQDFKNPYRQLCHFVAPRLAVNEEKVKQWSGICLDRSRLVRPWTSLELIRKDIQQMFAFLQISHLEIYTPAAAQAVWQGVVEDTGVESRFIEGQLVVMSVDPQSPAVSQVPVGSVIESLNGEHPNPWELKYMGGDILGRYAGKSFRLNLKPSSYIPSRDLVLMPIAGDKKTYYLRVRSFSRDLFSDGSWKKNFSGLSRESRFLVDLRGNSGGNFTAGLEFLSFFLCREVSIGELVRPLSRKSDSVSFPLSYDESRSIFFLRQHRHVELRVPEQKNCFTGPVVILTDNQTSSVAELVTLALKEQKRGLHLGERTAGRMMVGFWYDFEALGEGVQLSLPEAYFISPQNERIEIEGLGPDRILLHQLSEFKEGYDSWIGQALREFK